MNFGTIEFYRRLKSEFYADNNWEIHLLLEKEVRRVARFLAAQATNDPQLRRDAAEDALGRVFTYSIHRFLEDERFADCDDRARVNWLYRAVANAIRDSLRRARVRVRTVLRDEDGNPVYLYHASLDQTDEDGFGLMDALPDQSAGPLESMLLRQKAEAALRALFSMDSGVDHIIVAAAVMLNEAYGYLCGSKGLNRSVAGELSNSTPRRNLERIRRLLRALDLPEELAKPLEARLNGDEVPMNPSTRDVTRWVSEARVRLRKQFDDRVVSIDGTTGKDG